MSSPWQQKYDTISQSIRLFPWPNFSHFELYIALAFPAFEKRTYKLQKCQISTPQQQNFDPNILQFRPSFGLLGSYIRSAFPAFLTSESSPSESPSTSPSMSDILNFSAQEKSSSNFFKFTKKTKCFRSTRNTLKESCANTKLKNAFLLQIFGFKVMN